MGILSTTIALVGISIATGALLVLGQASALSGATNIQLLGGAIAGFLFGVLLFGWGLGKRVGY